jgi:hypothetical protein
MVAFLTRKATELPAKRRSALEALFFFWQGDGIRQPAFRARSPVVR